MVKTLSLLCQLCLYDLNNVHDFLSLDIDQIYQLPMQKMKDKYRIRMLIAKK